MTDTANTKVLFKQKKRVWELDFLRGLAVIAMCFDHLMCDFVYLPWWFENYFSIKNSFINGMVKFANMYWDSTFRTCAHYIFVFLFLFLVGTSCSFSRDNKKRGSMLFIVALAFTGVSLVLKTMGILDYGIIFGILDCIAMCILLAAAVDELTKANKHLNLYAPLVIGAVICLIGTVKKFWFVSNAEYWLPYDYEFNSSHLLDYAMGTIGFGDDWFGIFPNVGAVLLGLYFGKAVYSTRRSLLPMLDGKWNKPFRFVGRHALLFYIGHQAILSGLVMLLCVCLGYK